MAKFDVQMTSGSIPGTSGGALANLDTRTGNIQLAGAAGELAQAGIDMSIDMWRLQADTELTDAVAADQEELNVFFAKLKGNPDTHTYDAEFTKLMEGIEGRELKNGLAAIGHRKYITKFKPAWNNDLRKAKEAKTKETGIAALIEAEEKAKLDGNFVPVLTKLNSLVSVGLLGADEAAERLKPVVMAAEYNEAMRVVGNIENAEEFLRTYKNDKSPIMKDLPTVYNDPGKMRAMKNLAIGTIGDAQRGVARLTLKQTTAIKNSAMDDSVTSEFMAKKILQSDGLTNPQKESALKLFTRSRQTMTKGGNNAYRITENWGLYTEHRERAAKRRITEQEIVDSVGPGGYSWPEAERLIRVISGEDSSAKAFEDSGAAKNLIAQIKAMIPTTGALVDRVEVALNQFATQKGLELLEDAIQNNPDWTDRQKKEEALRIGRQLEREYDDGTLEAGLEEIFDRIPKPKTKAEYDALPTGTTYIHPTLGRVIKK